MNMNHALNWLVAGYRLLASLFSPLHNSGALGAHRKISNENIIEREAMAPNNSKKRLQHVRNKKKPLEETFKEINKNYVKIKKKDRKRNNAILFVVLNELLKIMKKQNKLFRSLRPRLEYLGSYFDGLRVGDPTEYDINVIMKLPICYDKICLNAEQAAADCTNIFMHSEFRRLAKTPATAHQGFNETELWCAKDYRLSVSKFRSWMQRVVDKALASLPVLNNRYLFIIKNDAFLIVTKASGPACTISIKEGNNDNSVIDVDLVPTFAFKLPNKPAGSNVSFDYIVKAKLDEQYFVVPKPSEDEFSWRLSFPFQERKIINDKNNLKSSVKLLKLLRDAQEFKQLASYYIKTLFLWEVKNQKDEFWKMNSLAFLVLHMLKLLRDCLSKCEIKNFWCPEVNLLKNKIKPQTCQNWSNRLANIIRNIENYGMYNQNIVEQYFTKK